MWLHLRNLLGLELEELYITHGIKTIAESMVKIFVPLYLFQLGYAIQAIIIFYIIRSVFHAATSPLCAKLSSRIGLKHSILISFPILVAFYIFLFKLPESPGMFYVLPALWGISGALYWVAFHTDFALSSKRKKRGSEVGLLHVFSDIARVFGPITGAFLITFFSFDTVFIVTSVALLLASTPLFFSKDIKLMPMISFKREVENFDRNIFVALFGGGMNGAVSMVFWPLFMFLALESYISIGWIHSLGILLALISSVLVGSIFDKRGKMTLLKISSIANSLLWIVRMGMTQLWHFAGQALVGGPITRGRGISVEATYYDSAAKSDDIPQFTIFREFSIHGGFIFMLVLLWIFFLFIESMQFAFLLAAISVLLSMAMLKTRK